MTSLVESEKKSPQSPFYSKLNQIYVSLAVSDAREVYVRIVSSQALSKGEKNWISEYLNHKQQCTWLHDRLVTVTAN